MNEPAELIPELIFQTARSGGKGGQNVNKVESKVELRFDVGASKILDDEQKALLLSKLQNRITAKGVLMLYHQTERSQLANKELVTEKFFRLIKQALTKERPRKATKPTLASVLRKKRQKTKRAELKASRRKEGFE